MIARPLAALAILTLTFSLLYENISYPVITAAAWAIAAMGLHVCVQYAGRASLGHAAFMSMGAYAGAHFGWAGLFIGMLACGGLGFGLGWLTSRLSSAAFALTTLTIGSTWFVVSGRFSVLGGRMGFSQVPRPEALWIVAVVVAALCFVTLHWLGQQSVARRWITARDVPDVAGAYGVDVSRCFAYAVAIATALAGLAGWIASSQSTAVTPSHFAIMDSLELYALVRLAGTRSIGTSAIRAAAWTVVVDLCSPLPGLAPALLGLFVIAQLRLRNGGATA